MISVFPYKNRIAVNKDRYIEAYALGLDTIDDWLRSGPTNDHLTPSRQSLLEKCQNLTNIPNWHFVDCGSDAIQAAVSVLSSPGDKIIMPAWGFIASPQNVLWINRKVVFCDNGTDGLMCPDSLSKAIDQHPDAKIVMPVHLLGRVQSISNIKKLIPESMSIIEDSANAFYLPGDNCEIPGTYSDLACFSFDMAKSPGCTGTGGAVAGQNFELINQIKEVTQQGFNKNRTDFISPACKSSIDDTSARIIVADINIMLQQQIREQRRANHKLFEDNINCEQLEGKNTMCLAFCFFPRTVSAVEAKKIFYKAGIQLYAAGSYPCFPTLSAFKNCKNVGYKYANRIASEMVIAPVHEFLTNADKERIISLANQL